MLKQAVFALLILIAGCQSPEPASITLPPVMTEPTTRASAEIFERFTTPEAAAMARPLALRAHIEHPGYPAGSNPDPIQTPGAVFDGITKAQLCVSGYTAKVRHVTEATKNQVFANYYITGPHGAYEVDHLVSLELGGSNDLANLWPESYSGTWNARVKDRIENKLHRLVCMGTITLQEAQKDIAGDVQKIHRTSTFSC